MTLDDTIFDDIRRKQPEELPECQQHALLDGQRLLSLLDRQLGPQHVQMSRKVPSALIQGTSAADIRTIVSRHLLLQNLYHCAAVLVHSARWLGPQLASVAPCVQINKHVMEAVWQETGTTEDRLWIKVTDISEGRKDDKAVQYVTFYSTDAELFCEDDPELVTTRFAETSLRSQYGLRIEEYHSARMCFCHLLYWKARHDELDHIQQLWDSFDRQWEVLHALLNHCLVATMPRGDCCVFTSVLCAGVQE